MTDIACAKPAAPPIAARAPDRIAARSFWALTLGSVGVVYGDIGTSPLYAFREAVLAAAESGPVTRDIVLGVLSLIVWALIIVVTIKYVLILLRADNNGEGGTLSLTALATRALGRRTPIVLLLGMIGAAMFLGDSVITPAISVLSAVEGLKLATPALEHYVLPLTVVILIALVRRAEPRHRAGRGFFGPVMVVWFIAIAVAGVDAHLATIRACSRRSIRSTRISFLVDARPHRPGHARRGVPGGHRRRGALCRSRPFRPQADPDAPGSAWCCRRC